MSDVRNIMGVSVLAATAIEAVQEIDRRVVVGERTQVAFLNAHTSNLAADDLEYRKTLQRFLVLNDGIGVNLASRWLYQKPFPENLNGTDFVIRYLRETQRKHLRLFLIGGCEGVAKDAGQKIEYLTAWQHKVVGTYHGYFAGAEEDVLAQIRRSGADVVLVGMGNPLQERFIDEWLGDVPLAFGVGALFDFLAGRVTRAPQWVREFQLEWVWRLAMEPKRMWRRYIIGNVVFLRRLV